MAIVPFVTHSPKKQGIAQVGEDKSHILRQNLEILQAVVSYANLSAELKDSLTISDVALCDG
jgi:hypothetical protein